MRLWESSMDLKTKWFLRELDIAAWGWLEVSLALPFVWTMYWPLASSPLSPWTLARGCYNARGLLIPLRAIYISFGGIRIRIGELVMPWRLAMKGRYSCGRELAALSGLHGLMRWRALWIFLTKFHIFFKSTEQVLNIQILSKMVLVLILH